MLVDKITLCVLCSAGNRGKRVGHLKDSIHPCLTGLTALITYRYQHTDQLSPPLYLTADISNIKSARDVSLQVTSLFSQSNASIACLNRLSWRHSLWEGTSELSNMTSLQR